MNMKNKRRNFTADEKVRILRQHLLEKVSVADLCEQYKLSPTLFYRWQKEFFENGTNAFGKHKNKKSSTVADKKIAKLEEKVKHKNDVIAEIMEAHFKLKKELGLD